MIYVIFYLIVFVLLTFGFLYHTTKPLNWWTNKDILGIEIKFLFWPILIPIILYHIAAHGIKYLAKRL